MEIVINALKKVGNATIVKQCTTLAGWLTTHPYLTFIGYNAIFAGMCWYMWCEGNRVGNSYGYEKGSCEAWDKGYKSGYANGEAYGRVDERYAQLIRANN